MGFDQLHDLVAVGRLVDSTHCWLALQHGGKNEELELIIVCNQQIQFLWFRNNAG